MITSDMVRPDAQAWAALPKPMSTRRQRLLGWLTGLLGTASAFIADRGWEAMDDPSWYGAFRLIDMIGSASILLASAFCLAGWMLGRYAVVAAPLVLAFAAVPHALDGYTSAPVWWLWAAAGAVLAAVVAGQSWREVRAVRAVARSSATGLSITVGRNAVLASKRVVRRGRIKALVMVVAACAGWVVAFSVLPSELGRTYEEMGQESSSGMFAAAAAAFSILAVAVLASLSWQVFAMSRAGRSRVWEIPAGVELAPPWPFEDKATGLVSVQETTSAGCICLPEFRRSFPDADSHFLDEEGVYASDYCPGHGIDRINEFSAHEFAARAGTSWLWDERSDAPERARPDARRLLLYGYAGRAFTGIPVRERAGLIDASFPWVGPAHEAEAADAVPGWDSAQRPASGVLDVIDLRPAGYAGSAFRYRHGRAWFEAPQIGASESDQYDRRGCPS
ncbi:hypothetical protein R5O87_19300 [Arthrobacter globiformis]|uniref:hypothetical protein n=1 Tax=Arthrobacter globiformis TaxID=1665 RepID=UPI003978780A